MVNKNKCVCVDKNDLNNDLSIIYTGKQGPGKAVYLKDVIDKYKRYYDDDVVMDMKKEDLL